MKKSFLTVLFITFILAGCKSTQKAAAIPQIPNIPQTAEMQETYWRLTELMGKPVKTNEKMKKDIHIILKKEGNQVQGFSGCNSFVGKYELKEGSRITFSALASTMMACPDLALETEFNNMLTTVDNYSINGTVMTLNKAKMAPLARFESFIIK